MDPTPIGTAVGAAVATFLAMWRGAVHPLKKKLDAPPSVPKDVLVRLAALEVQAADRAQRLATIESENRELRRRLDEQAKNVDHLEMRVSRTVTAEEFAAHVASTAQAIQNLSEKVGQARGAIETWLTTLRR